MDNENENDGGDECQPTTSNTNGLCPIFQMSFFLYSVQSM